MDPNYNPTGSQYWGGGGYGYGGGGGGGGAPASQGQKTRHCNFQQRLGEHISQELGSVSTKFYGLAMLSAGASRLPVVGPAASQVSGRFAIAGATAGGAAAMGDIMAGQKVKAVRDFVTGKILDRAIPNAPLATNGLAGPINDVVHDKFDQKCSNPWKGVVNDVIDWLNK